MNAPSIEEFPNMRKTGALIALLLLLPALARSETMVDGRRSLVLEGEVALLMVDIAGGSIADFHLKDGGLNPLQWGSRSNPNDPPSTDPRAMGHFLCLDRWGPASEAERANGMGWHGEATRVVWEVVQDAQKKRGFIHAEMAAMLPMAGLAVRRLIKMADDRPFFTVREEVTNKNKLGRIYNMVQHPTIGPPFLDESTVVDANGRKGFMQGGTLPHPEEPSVHWPQALTRDGQPVNMRHLTDDAHPNVVSYVIDEEYGWVTAGNASQGLLIGYIWKSEDYAWFDAWRSVNDGKPHARGLEFGTTGLHQPFPILVAKGRIFDREIFEYIDAGQTVARSYANFLCEIPSDYRGVAGITYAGGQLTLRERDGGADRDLVLEVGELFPE